MGLGAVLDRVVGVLSPGMAARRMSARRYVETMERVRAYEGASWGRRLKGWNTSGGSADAETQNALEILRNRCRDMVRSVPWAATAINVLEDETIGAGIVPTVMVPAQDSDRSRREARRLSGLVQEAWATWAEELGESDPEGRVDYYGQQAQILRSCAEAGEGLVRQRFRRQRDAMFVPLQLQLLEPDHLDSTRTQRLRDGGAIVQGVEFDPIGRRRAYWLFRDHPGNTTLPVGTSRFESVRVPASSVLHVFRPERIGQTRGVPIGAAAIVKLREVADAQDAHLVRQKIAACFVGFVHSADPETSGFAKPTSSGELPEDDKFEPGLFQHLPFGTEIKFGNPPTVEGFREFVELDLMAVASAFGVSYESLTGDFSRVNFHSGRLGRIRQGQNVRKWRAKALMPGFLRPTFRWFLEAAVTAGRLPEEALAARAVWTPPPMALTDPSREIRSAKEEVRAGLTSLSDAIRARGRDPRAVLEQLAQDVQLLDELGLRVESDGRTAGAGQAQASADRAAPNGRGASPPALPERTNGRARSLDQVLEDLRVDSPELAEALEEALEALA